MNVKVKYSIFSLASHLGLHMWLSLDSRRANQAQERPWADWRDHCRITLYPVRSPSFTQWGWSPEIPFLEGGAGWAFSGPLTAF